jgi:sulfur carrier protein
VTHVESLLVNGVQRSVAAGTTVDDMVALIAPDKRGVAVAVNGEVVPKSAWVRTTVGAGDTVEVLTAAQGG